MVQRQMNAHSLSQSPGFRPGPKLSFIRAAAQEENTPWHVARQEFYGLHQDIQTLLARETTNKTEDGRLQSQLSQNYSFFNIQERMKRLQINRQTQDSPTFHGITPAEHGLENQVAPGNPRLRAAECDAPEIRKRQRIAFEQIPRGTKRETRRQSLLRPRDLVC